MQITAIIILFSFLFAVLLLADWRLGNKANKESKESETDILSKIVGVQNLLRNYRGKAQPVTPSQYGWWLLMTGKDKQNKRKAYRFSI